MDWSSPVIEAAELIGTAAFAVSGALAGVEKKLDLFGVIFLAGVTALGGGTIRDLLLGRLPPRMFYHYTYLALAALTALLVFFLQVKVLPGRQMHGQTAMSWLFVLCDAIGLGVFAVAGTDACLQAGYSGNLFLAVFLGMTTGVGGGLLRDVMCGAVPAVLRKHIYALAAIAGSLCYYLLRIFLELPQAFSALLCIFLVVLLRLLAAYFRWNLPRPE